MENPFSYDHFVGFDWARDHHHVVVVDRQGCVLQQLRFEHSIDGWKAFDELVARYPSSAIAIETSSGVVVEQLFQRQLAVYPVQPRAAKSYRERKAPSGVKDDLLDAWALADALRVDGQQWRRLRPDDPVVLELRLLCRDQVVLIEQQTSLINQLRQALVEYHPALLDAFDDWGSPVAWKFLTEFPTPAKLAKTKDKVRRTILKELGCCRPDTIAQRLAALARPHLVVSDAVVAAKSLFALSLAHQWLALESQLKVYRQRIADLFEKHPDHELFGSLPGAGEKLAPRLLAELGDEERDVTIVQAYAGTAPISFQSGQIHKVRFRQACNKHLRAAVHLWADLSRLRCAWANVYYQQKRREGKSHACALRCLGQRWLKILCKMRSTHARYEEALHTQNQLRHGSWVFQLLPAKG